MRKRRKKGDRPPKKEFADYTNIEAKFLNKPTYYDQTAFFLSDTWQTFFFFIERKSFKAEIVMYVNRKVYH
jgi:hypothetical protein